MAKVAFLFPGQGAQAAGMGKDFAQASAAARAVYEEANDTLGWDVAKLCFEGPKAELDRTAKCQPAILTTSIAILSAMREAKIKDVTDCTAVAGLSLGEYSALVMAKAMKFDDALRLVEKRGRFMEEACAQNPGAMMSVLGLDDEIVEAICAQAREIGMVIAANFNCPGQVVISGQMQAVERASELARQKGAKRVVPLAVSGAFHSPLMESAAKLLEAELQSVSIRPCKMTLVANVTAEPVAQPADIRDSLSRQVKSAVRWTQSMRWLAKDGYTRFVEIGPGKVLSGLMKRIAPECQMESFATADALKPAHK